MTIQEAREFFAASDFSDETKKKISDVLADKRALDEKIVQSVKALMQEELDKDFAEAGVVLTDDQTGKANAAYAADIKRIESDLDEDTAYVEEELTALDGIRKKLMKTSDNLDAAAIRSTI